MVKFKLGAKLWSKCATVVYKVVRKKGQGREKIERQKTQRVTARKGEKEPSLLSNFSTERERVKL